MKKHLLTNSYDEGGITRLRNNAFTLIELLAIIVILAIIAVITVPIILNIIENSRKGAAQDSALGFKDSVNKYYVTELANNRNFQLEGDYTITDGKLSGTNITKENGVEIPVSGTKPTSGTLTYSNNTLTSGCLVIGDYAVTFDGGNVSKTEKNGECKNFPTMAEMCPECKFIYTTSLYAIAGSISANTYADPSNYPYYSTDIPTSATDDYTDWTSGENSQFFGLIENEQGKIGRAFVCGVENGEPFCLEGGIDERTLDSKPIYTSNVGILNDFLGCDASTSDSEANCNGSNLPYVGAANYGNAIVVSPNKTCGVDHNGTIFCY